MGDNQIDAPAYWKFESIPLLRRVNKLSVPLKMTLVDGASNGAAHIGGHYTKVLADANSVACLREREH
jgi:hypothetical protein